MASLAETATYDADIYQIETTDPVVGGVPNPLTGAGMSNIPHLQLARRTAWLKAQVDDLLADVAGIVVTDLLASPAALYAGDLNALTGRKIVQVTGAATNGFAGLAAGDLVLHAEVSGTAAIQFGLRGTSTGLGLFFRAKVASVWSAWRSPVENGNAETIAGNKTLSGNTTLNGTTALAGAATAAGVTSASVNDGTPAAAATYRPDPLAATTGNMRHITNNAAFTLAAPNRAGDYTMTVLVTNGATAGAITMSGFTKVYGDAFTTTNAQAFMVSIIKQNGLVLAVVQACQ
ncbi:hypothetical protein [Fuscibacter oryzae]|uniref:Uncharacterized protein n=1 Tax=Fuscibacter oryzae TaxID=2803939 RepID=A0A8J7MXN9_9RHOB|nr:hypothetical protein [Fuscibacter oryzae]MBL4929324.1 hypothetical protein [Fuscibacter oryzae]